MKTYLSLLLLLITGIAKSQTVIPLENYYKNNNNRIEKVYFADVNGLLDKYVGTWEYNNGAHYFKVQFIKKLRTHDVISSAYKRKPVDIICGFYQYKLNGIEVYNTFPVDCNLYEQELENTYIYSTKGSIYRDNFQVYYNEPTLNYCGRDRFGDLKLEYSVIEGIETLHWDREDEIQMELTFCRRNNKVDETPFKAPCSMELVKIN